MGIFDFLGEAFSGSPAEYEQVSQYTPEQLRIEKERRKASKGAFGQSADYYKGILNNDPSAFAAFEAPAQRQFNEQIIPDLAEQFAGMGAGGLSSSGFRNAAVGAGTDLSERLASMRAGLRESAASNLMNLGQQALTPHTQYQQTNPGSQGAGGGIMQGLGAAIPGAISGFMTGGPAGAAVGAGLGFLGGGNKGGSGQFGTSSPYGSMSSSITGATNPYRR